MNKGIWKRLGRTLAAALLAGSLTVGAVSAIAPAISTQPVAAAVATTQYPQLGFNYGDNRATIYIDPTNFTADQLTSIRQGIGNVQSMLAGIFTFTMTDNRSQADIIFVGHDFSDTVSSTGSRGGDTSVNNSKVYNHIAQHPNGTQIRLDDSYRSFVTSPDFTQAKLPAQTDPNYQYYFNYYKNAVDKWHHSTMVVATEHELGHAIGLDHAPVATYGDTLMNPIVPIDGQGNILVNASQDPVYIRSVQAIYGGQAIALGETDVKQPTQGYHNSNASNSGNSGNTGNTGNNGNSGNAGNAGNTGNAGSANNGKPAQNNTVKSANGSVFVGQSAGAEVYSDPNFTNNTGRVLPMGSNWKGFAIVSDAAGNPVGFNVGGQQYVKFSQAAFAYATGTEHKSEPVSGVFKINVPGHPTWGTAFYTDYLQVKGVLRGGSKWRVYARKTLSDGKQYYNLGGNQWIRADYGSFN